MSRWMSDDLIKRSDAIGACAYETIECYEARKTIRNLPSADRPQEWIPCKERLPKEAGHYLCSFKKPRCVDNIYVDLAYWTGDRWYGYLAPEIKAWMPLPEPWKGADD